MNGLSKFTDLHNSIEYEFRSIQEVEPDNRSNPNIANGLRLNHLADTEGQRSFQSVNPGYSKGQIKEQGLRYSYSDSRIRQNQVIPYY